MSHYIEGALTNPGFETSHKGREELARRVQMGLCMICRRETKVFGYTFGCCNRCAQDAVMARARKLVDESPDAYRWAECTHCGSQRPFNFDDLDCRNCVNFMIPRWQPILSLQPSLHTLEEFVALAIAEAETLLEERGDTSGLRELRKVEQAFQDEGLSDDDSELDAVKELLSDARYFVLFENDALIVWDAN